MSINNHQLIINYFNGVLQKNVSSDVWKWLTEKAATFKTKNGNAAFFMAFTVIPRHTGKAALILSEVEIHEINHLRNGFILSHYTVDRLARLWLLLHWPSEDKTAYLKTISQLFKSAEMNELVALYGALPLFAYPEEWAKQCAEGIRSNIGTVLESIMIDNPYPSEYLDELAWNQLVMKAFFTEKPANRIIGLDQRANQKLAYILSDYTHERWAANRTIDPQLWRLTGKFIDERIYLDIKKVFREGSSTEKEAVALACSQSKFLPAQVLLKEAPILKSAIESNRLNWEYIANIVQTNSI